MKYVKEAWCIISKDNKAIACGVPRNRSLERMDINNNKRILLYGSKLKAEAAFKNGNWFYDFVGKYKPEDMIAVKCSISVDLETL
jgi:hypothetical protein